MPKNETILHQPIEVIIFDCDGTLCQIEGVDELAAYNGVADKVKALTAQAMGETGITANLYAERLDIVQPTREQVQQLGEQYIKTLMPEVQSVVTTLLGLGKQVYLVSAGLYPAVRHVGEYLGIAPENIYAVDIHFDDQGKYQSFDQSSPLVSNVGKREIVSAIKKHYTQIAYVGDGMNDIAVIDLVTRFIGFGGVFYRKKIEEKSDFYIKNASMAELVPLVLTESEQSQ